MPIRTLLALAFLGLLASCSKPVDLPDRIVTAADRGEFTRFRAELGADFPAERLSTFDTAVQELQLDAMARHIAPAEARELDMLAVANGKTVRAVELLGWQARCARFKREIAQIAELKAADQKLTQTPGVTARMQRAQDLIDKLQADLSRAERELASMSASSP